MKATSNHKLYIPLFCFFIAACSVTKSVPKGDKLYTGASVKLNSAGLPAREKKVVRSDLQGLVRPKPNTKLLGIPFKLHIYNLFYKAKPKSFFGKLRDRFGQPPVLLSSVDLENNQKILKSHLENKGFFHAKLNADTVVKKKTASAVYSADAGAQYHINSVIFVNDSSTLARVITESSKASLLQKDNAYDLDVIKGERMRIDAYLKERGFYYFSPELLLIQVDSNLGNNLVNMRVIIKPETPANALDIFTINNIYLYSNYHLNTAVVDTNLTHLVAHEDYYVVDPKKKIKPKMFEQALQFRRGDVYNRTDHNQTLNRLINLNVFKFVKNRFQKVPDSAKLDVYYYLTPLPKNSLRAEFNVTTKSNNLNGTQISGTWLNRNILKAAEQLTVSAYAGTEVQFGGKTKGNNTYRSGAEINLTIPRFIVPLTDIRTRGGYIPRTNIQVGYDLLTKIKFYTLNQYRFGFGYLWQVSPQKRHEFYPVSISYIQPLSVSKEFRDSIVKYQFLEHVVDSQFILGTTYQYTYNELAAGLKKINSFYFNGLFDVSGNVAGLIATKNSGTNNKQFLNKAFDQFIKLEADARFYHRLGVKSSVATRAIIGYGLPYGNSGQLPYVKQFFSGGNNSIRAFRSRSLLGSYRFPDSTGFLPDQTGDLKLEMNAEYRPNISGPLYGAFFIDAGNTWLKNEDPTRPGAKFSKDFLQQLAVGAGVGIRLDIQLFVIRFDVAFPLRKPWEQNPWVINQIRLGQKEWRKENIVFNLAIGYPF